MGKEFLDKIQIAGGGRGGDELFFLGEMDFVFHAQRNGFSVQKRGFGVLTPCFYGMTDGVSEVQNFTDIFLVRVLRYDVVFYGDCRFEQRSDVFNGGRFYFRQLLKEGFVFGDDGVFYHFGDAG